MKILIAGSIPGLNDDQNVPKNQEPTDAQRQAYEEKYAPFQNACNAIGVELAKRKHTVVVGSKNPTTADKYILAGIDSVAGTHQAIVVRGNDARPLPTREDYPNIEFHRRLRGNGWAVARAYQLREADAVIAIQGGSGTLQLGLSAPALERPVVALPQFGGSAKQLWDEFEKNDYRRGGLSDADLTALQEPWSANSAAAVVNSLETLVRRNPYRVTYYRTLIPLLLGVALLIVSWILAFAFWNPVIDFAEGLFASRNPSGAVADSASRAAVEYDGWPLCLLFVLTGLAATLGVVMRGALPMLDGRFVSFEQLLRELVVGFLVGFGFILFYLSSGIILHGEAAPDVRHFRTAAVATSILAFAVAFFLENAAEMLRSRLGAQLKDRKSENAGEAANG